MGQRHRKFHGSLDLGTVQMDPFQIVESSTSLVEIVEFACQRDRLLVRIGLDFFKDAPSIAGDRLKGSFRATIDSSLTERTSEKASSPKQSTLSTDCTKS